MTISPKLRAALVAVWLVSSITYLVLAGAILYHPTRAHAPLTLGPGTTDIGAIAAVLLGANIVFSLVFIAERITMRAARAETTTA